MSTNKYINILTKSIAKVLPKKKTKLDKILNLVEDYISEVRSAEKWEAGKDWVKYSGPHIDGNEYSKAVETLLGEWLIYGKNCRNFEIAFPKHLGMKHGCLTNSGSSANLLMVSSLTSKNKMPAKYRLNKGDKVITPVVCFPTTINPLIQNGLVPVFVDVDLPSVNLNLDMVEELLDNDKDKEIKAIIFAHVLGNPPDMDRLMKLVNKHNLIFLEDACDALGSTYDGKKLGSFGLMSTCSFFPAHHMTMGEGGFVATNSRAIRSTVASFRDWGRACFCNEMKPGDVTAGTACGDRFKEWLPGCPKAVYDHRYVFDEIGYNIKPLDLQAAMGLQQLKKLPQMDQARRNNFNKLYKIFKPYEKYFYLPKATEKADPCWFGFLLVTKPDAPFEKQQFVRHMEKAKIQTRSYFTGNALYHPAYQEMAKQYEDLDAVFPNAHTVTMGSVFLGTYIGLTDEKISYIKKTVDKFFEGLK
jgi:CDP-6-deoxy-D-xylo-4-hexulose-3-dehydrase